MAGDGRAIFIGQATRSDELHDAGVIEQQDGGTIAVERRSIASIAAS